jgi:AcrR family transcriptional regulator
VATTRAEQAQRTRLAVLDTARLLFAEHGFHGTSLQLIADSMGVRKANVYYYFRTKAEILEALLAERIAALEAMLDAAATVADRPARQLLMIDGFVEQVVIAHRTVAPVDFADPGIRSHDAVAGRLDALTARGLHLFSGDRPTVDDEAAYLLVTDLKPVLRRFTDLPDDELRATLRRLCLRLIGHGSRPGLDGSGAEG